ncbi:hypothetical protein DWB61_15845 [Ancylomarina euxinus]|uniref:Uncharacterized protein n=1 Tax=Ancylomarina euxinus TaxID=2283627 RepID=A0A425XX79_9BACT|nr:hypothetical protein [Ancylomarina euxinus]MCZ4696132.1 hypothetical protein [Ancylomarina euxinus]MUP16541.1 hypothetical protein [Ancylomarina euxinus]RRG19248.1 hypothetical protein DWB61_15845 [Ancylomarina euxinus]
MNDKTKKEIKFLKVYSGFLTVVLLSTIFYVMNQTKDRNFKEINVERINIVESNGDLKLVISNSKRQHQGIINGKPLPKRERQAGLIFFNSVGDECGGLIYDGNDKEAGLVLSVDKYRDDQVMQLRYVENTEKDARTYGMQFWDYPKEDGYQKRNKAFEDLQKIEDNKEKRAAYLKMKQDGLLPEDRMFVGKKMNKDVGLFINDNKGRPRIKIYIDNDNNPKIELLNEAGNVLVKE